MAARGPAYRESTELDRCCCLDCCRLDPSRLALRERRKAQRALVVFRKRSPREVAKQAWGVEQLPVLQRRMYMLLAAGVGLAEAARQIGLPYVRANAMRTTIERRLGKKLPRKWHQ